MGPVLQGSWGGGDFACNNDSRLKHMYTPVGNYNLETFQMRLHREFFLFCLFSGFCFQWKMDETYIAQNAEILKNFRLIIHNDSKIQNTDD